MLNRSGVGKKSSQVVRNIFDCPYVQISCVSQGSPDFVLPYLGINGKKLYIVYVSISLSIYIYIYLAICLGTFVSAVLHGHSASSSFFFQRSAKAVNTPSMSSA